MPAFAKVYKSFEEFEREELRKLSNLSTSIDDMFDDWFVDDLDFNEEAVKRSEKYEEERW